MSEVSRAHKPRYVLHVFNRGSDSESSDDDRRPAYHNSVYSYHPPALPGLSRSPPAPPSPLTTNIPTRIPRTSASHQSLSSPSSASSPAAEEPTPSTDESNIPDRSHRADVPPITTTRGAVGKIYHGLKSPFQYKSPHPRPQPPTPSSAIQTTSPTVSTPDSYTSASSVSSSSTVSDRVLILATADSERYVNVDITGAKSADYIRECVFSKLNILDDEQSCFSIYRTEIGFFALGEALSDEKLMELCRADGDSKGSLKLLVSHASAAVHEPIRPSNSSHSPSVSTVPPPVLPNYNSTVSCAPLRPRRRSRSRHGSLSSAEQLTTEVSAGYEADLDNNTEREPLNRPTPVRPLPPITALANSVPASPGRRPNAPARAPSPKPSRSNTPSPPTVSERTRGSEAVVQDRFGNLVPAPPPPPPLSPHRPTFALNDEHTLVPPRTRHTRSGSDAAAEREQYLAASEQQMQSAEQRWRPGARLNTQPSRDTLRDRRPQRPGTQPEEPTEQSDSWIFIRKPGGTSQPSYDPEASPPLRHSPIKRTLRKQQPLSPVRYQSQPYSSRPLNIPAAPRQPPPTIPMLSPDTRPGPSRAAGHPVPANFIVTWKGEEKGDLKPSPGGAPWSRSLKGAKSMDSLRAASIPQNLQPGRRGNAQSPLNRSSNNLAFAPSKPSYDSRSHSRPLPMKGSPQQPSQPSQQYSSRSPSSGYGNGYMSPTGPDPYPRPHSALSDVMSSPTNKYPGMYQRSAYPSSSLDYMDSTRSNPISLLPLAPTRQNSRPSESVHNGPVHISPPQSPSSPQSPRSLPQDRFISSSARNSLETTSSEKTLNAKDGGWLLDAVMSAASSEATIVPSGHDRTYALSSSSSSSSTNVPPMSASSFDGDGYDSDPDECGTSIWKRRPVLTVHIEGTNGQVISPPSAVTSSGSQPAPSPSSGRRGRGRGSTFTDTRPPAEDVYNHLDMFFPEHDLDKPVIEANSGGTSPTAGEQLPSPPEAPPPAEPPLEDTMIPIPPIPPIPERSRIKGKKSIRVVAEEHKRRINRVSRQDAAEYNASVLRKRSTKLWGSRLEEVTPAQAKANLANALPDSPGGPTTFKWVRGELIGKGSYGRVYLALNATTGEMIAVKQVEMPRTASDKNDSRQVTVVQSLKLESETLKDLDHPNIVQYLGFEETPANLSIFLEYVPGGSIGSILLKHGKFAENVTKSFTKQILAGLEYLHSKGILHRDLKADNILVEMSGVCKISDFGISKRTQDTAGGAETAMQGTVFWMAPEVVNPQGKGYNFKVDIWSVGCVVLEMWAGTRPWQGDEMVAVMFKLYQLRQPPPVPEGITLTELADDFREKCFAINPDERPSAMELQRHPYLTVTPGWVFTDFLH